ncbi:uncharacterized protein LOC127131930 [Lathyrus oleraceus]|uniref:uncharacterized protein LOC127131930 n=1 Tax=Pisum sativum TaxID=3888 RepID=UPI0021CDF0A8|nr:uncharacterized protein LOC127131930 [Pisum sativum]
MVQCYCCDRFDHFAKDCWSNKENKSEEENITRGDFDDEPVLFMAYESNDDEPMRLTIFYSKGDSEYDSESEDDYEYEVESDFEYESESKGSEEESESEGSEDESESEDDSEVKDDLESEGDSEDEEDSEGESDFEGESDSGLESGGHPNSENGAYGVGVIEGRAFEGGGSEGDPTSEGGQASDIVQNDKEILNKVDKISISGYLFKYLASHISCCSKKQPVVALSTCEAEYISGVVAACQAVWLLNLLQDLDQGKQASEVDD